MSTTINAALTKTLKWSCNVNIWRLFFQFSASFTKLKKCVRERAYMLISHLLIKYTHLITVIYEIVTETLKNVFGGFGPNK